MITYHKGRILSKAPIPQSIKQETGQKRRALYNPLGKQKLLQMPVSKKSGHDYLTTSSNARPKNYFLGNFGDSDPYVSSARQGGKDPNYMASVKVETSPGAGSLKYWQKNTTTH